MTPEEITRLIAGMSDPSRSIEPADSEQTLARLIRLCRDSLKAGRRRRHPRLYAHQQSAFTRAILLVQDAPADELRAFAGDVVDLLWGEGSAASERDARRLDFDKEWKSDTIEEVAFLLARYSIYPFPRG